MLYVPLIQNLLLMGRAIQGARPQKSKAHTRSGASKPHTEPPIPVTVDTFGDDTSEM